MFAVCVSVNTPSASLLLSRDARLCEVRQVIVLDTTRVRVLRQAAGKLTALWFSQWRTEATLGEVANRHDRLVDN